MNQENQNRLYEYFADSPVAISIFQGPDLIIETGNAAFAQILGGRDFIGKALADVAPESVNQPFPEIIREVLKTGLPKVLPEALGQVMNDGVLSSHYYHVSFQPLKDQNGKVDRVLQILVDITEQVRNRESLEKAKIEAELERESFRNLVMQTATPTATVVGPDFVFDLTNEAYEKLVGQTNLRGQKVFELFPGLSDQARPILEKVFQTGERIHVPRSTRFVDFNNDGVPEMYYLDAHYSPLKKSNGEIYGVLISAYDVTREVLEQERAANQRDWLESILEELPFAFFLVHPTKGEVKFANKKAREFMGVSFVGQSTATRTDHPFQLFDMHGNEIPYTEAPSARIARGENITGTEFKIRTPTGLYHLLNFSHVLPAEYGYDSMALLAMLDVTAERRAEADVRLRETQLALALETSKVGFYDWDIPNNKTTLSEQMKEDWGFKAAGMAAPEKIQDILPFIHEEDRDRVTQEIERTMAEATPYDVEYRVVRPDGKIVWLAVRGRVEYISPKNPVRFFGTCLNITEQKIHEAKLEKSASDFRFLANTMPQIVWTAREDGVWNYTNDRWSEYSGSRDSHRWLEFVHSDDLQFAMETWTRSVRTGDLFQAEFRIRKFDDSYHWFLVRALATDQKNEETRWYGTCTDVSEQKELENEVKSARALAESANHAKSSFLANMSHEIRTPLGAILGFSDLLKEGNLTNAMRDQFVDTIVRNGKSLTRIIDDILDLSKVEAGMLSLEKVEFSFFQLLEEVVELFRAKAKVRDLYLMLNISDSVSEMLCSDPTRVRQILINLIGNAVKFTESGGIKINVKSESIRADRARFEIKVKDTGVGILPDQRSKLFQPFTQADNSTTRKFGGTGLGLALSKRLAGALGGDIYLEENQDTQGSTFVLTFEADIPVKKTVAQEIDESLDRAALPLSGLKILVAEDSPDNQYLIRYLLNKNGASIDLVQNGQEAVDQADKGRYDLVLMDIQMPVMDGYSALKNLRLNQFSKPVIALTAHAMDEEKKKTKQAGFSAHLTKPLEAKELVSTILSVVTKN